MIAYVLKSALTLTLLYGCFAALLSRETFHRFNRAALLAIMVASLVLPLVSITLHQPAAPIVAVHREGEWIARQLNGKYTIVPVGESASQEFSETSETSEYSETSERSETATTFSPAGILLTIYAIGVAAIIIVAAVRLARLAALLRRGLRHTDRQGNTVILQNGDIPPFSIFRCIVMSAADYERHRAAILTHEQEHIRLRHSLDILFLSLVRTLQWFNPFAWMLGRDLQAIHEFEADEAVIRKGIDATQYQQLLVAKAVGNRLQPFANNLNHSPLKQRIIMMTKQKSPRAMMLKALVALPVLAIVACSFAKVENSNQTEEESDIAQSDSILLTPNGYPASECPIVHWFGKSKNGFEHDEYHVHVPVGTLVDIGGHQHLESMYFYLFPDEVAKPLMMLDGQPFDKDSLPSLKCDVVKMLKIDHDGHRATVDIITRPVVIPDTVRSNMVDSLSYTIAKDGRVMLNPTDFLNPNCGRLDSIPAAARSVRIGFGNGVFKKNPRAVACLTIERGTPEAEIEKTKQYILDLGIDKLVTREVDSLESNP